MGTTINTGLWYNTENGIKVHPEKRDLGTTLKTGLRYISDLRGGCKWAMLSNIVYGNSKCLTWRVGNLNCTYSTKVHQEKQYLGTTINTGLWYNTENRIKVHQ